MKKIALALSLIFNVAAFAECATEISCPTYCGGFYGGASWVYLQPAPTDGDLEYGSLITLTDDLPNLTAILLENRPGYESGFTAHLGYRFACTNQNLELSYLYFNGSDTDKTKIKTRNQFIQNFLGASYATAKSSEKQRLNQVDLTYGADFLFDNCLQLHPFLSLRYADIHRRLSVKYDDLVLNPSPSFLKGKEKSKYWGVGPVIGTDFIFPLFWRFQISGHVGGGLLFGNIDSRVDSTSVREPSNDSFSAKECKERISTVVNSDVALTYSQPICDNLYELNFELGYRVDYYFKAVDRINPFNGYVNNATTFPVSQPSNFGLSGPYFLISFQQALPLCRKALSCCPLTSTCMCSGLYFQFTSAWLEPCPTHDDLTYALLNEGPGRQKKIQVRPDHTWTGTYELGYLFNHSVDLQAKYFSLDTSDKKSAIAAPHESISSLNASGPSFVVFSEANSKASYRLHQFDFTLGKYLQLYSRFNLHGFFGVRYLDINRKQNNSFLGGEPPLTTQSKFPILKSHLWGVGPIFGIEPDFCLFYNFSITGLFDLAFLVGDVKARLDQDNFGLLGRSSNDVSTPSTPAIVPAIDTRIGLKYEQQFSCFAFNLEAGYQFTEYFRTINLLFPTLLTGLEQNGSNLILQGPYLTGGINIAF